MEVARSLLDIGNDLLDIGNGVFVPFFYGHILVESRQNPLVVDLTFRHGFSLPVRDRHQFRPSREATRKHLLPITILVQSREKLWSWIRRGCDAICSDGLVSLPSPPWECFLWLDPSLRDKEGPVEGKSPNL